ncbi:hypothetical protein CC78DRAFT_575491 [Lojkania enalia]|uniref:Uncharacterized protein n=1 Tax=Lojkania enalia TaxID=147567 RepID=A0A9P4N6W7_9PLEO|nr:hypothetical protein CC78DRAFT_575491 [Didymosphaeria enalia]
MCKEARAAVWASVAGAFLEGLNVGSMQGRAEQTTSCPKARANRGLLTQVDATAYNGNWVPAYPLGDLLKDERAAALAGSTKYIHYLGQVYIQEPLLRPAPTTWLREASTPFQGYSAPPINTPASSLVPPPPTSCHWRSATAPAAYSAYILRTPTRTFRRPPTIKAVPRGLGVPCIPGVDNSYIIRHSRIACAYILTTSRCVSWPRHQTLEQFAKYSTEASGQLLPLHIYFSTLAHT